MLLIGSHGSAAMSGERCPNAHPVKALPGEALIGGSRGGALRVPGREVRQAGDSQGRHRRQHGRVEGRQRQASGSRYLQSTRMSQCRTCLCTETTSHAQDVLQGMDSLREVCHQLQSGQPKTT